MGSYLGEAPNPALRGLSKKEINKRKDLLGLINVVVFSPEEETITKNGPKDRRRFFDRVFSIVSKKYLEDLLKYNSILQHRNAILKNGLKKNLDKQLEIWDEQFADKAATISSESIKIPIKPGDRYWFILLKVKKMIIDLHY